VPAPPRWLRILLFALCALAAAAALYLGLANTDTDDPEPGWALESPALHRVAVIVALFLCFYVFLVAGGSISSPRPAPSRAALSARSAELLSWTRA
jgi:hypothetical protein